MAEIATLICSSLLSRSGVSVKPAMYVSGTVSSHTVCQMPLQAVYNIFRG